MDNRHREYSTEGMERASSSGVGQMLRSWVKRTRKKHLPHQDPPQSSNSPVSGIQEMPDNQIPGIQEMPDNQIPSHLRAPRRLSGLNYPATQGQDYMDMLATPPVTTSIYSPQPPQELGQQAYTIPPEVIPGMEIIIALMGVTGKIQSLFKTYI